MIETIILAITAVTIIPVVAVAVVTSGIHHTRAEKMREMQDSVNVAFARMELAMLGFVAPNKAAGAEMWRLVRAIESLRDSAGERK